MAFFLMFAALSNSAIKKTFHLHFKTDVTPLFFHPFRTVSLPSAVVRTLYISINQIGMQSFQRDQFKININAFRWDSCIHLLLDLLSILSYKRFLIKRFADPLTVKSSGRKKCVILAGTLTTLMLRLSKI